MFADIVEMNCCGFVSTVCCTIAKETKREL